jgi:hypothetical protein
MLYISLVAFLLYFAMANLPLATVAGNTGQPVFFMRFMNSSGPSPVRFYFSGPRSSPARRGAELWLTSSLILLLGIHCHWRFCTLSVAPAGLLRRARRHGHVRLHVSRFCQLWQRYVTANQSKRPTRQHRIRSTSHLVTHLSHQIASPPCTQPWTPSMTAPCLQFPPTPST